MGDRNYWIAAGVALCIGAVIGAYALDRAESSEDYTRHIDDSNRRYDESAREQRRREYEEATRESCDRVEMINRDGDVARPCVDEAHALERQGWIRRVR